MRARLRMLRSWGMSQQDKAATTEQPLHSTPQQATAAKTTVTTHHRTTAAKTTWIPKLKIGLHAASFLTHPPLSRTRGHSARTLIAPSLPKSLLCRSFRQDRPRLATSSILHPTAHSLGPYAPCHRWAMEEMRMEITSPRIRGITSRHSHRRRALIWVRSRDTKTHRLRRVFVHFRQAKLLQRQADHRL